MRIFLFACTIVLLVTKNASAHYHMLIPDKHSAKTGEEVTITYQFGHPFEHQLFNTAEPTSATIYRPDGTPVDVKVKLKKVQIPGDAKKNVTAYQLAFKPEQRGDHIIVFTSPAVTLEGEKEPLHDTAKVILHVQTQQGWDFRGAHGKDQQVDLVPLTRPYGLRAGMLFRATFLDTGRKKNDVLVPIKSAHVEIELYHPEPPKEFPPDEHTTYTARTDGNGILATSLPDADWWAVTAIKAKPDGKHRCTFWVHVDGKIPLKPAE